MKYKETTMYRDQNGKFISKQKYNNYKKKLQNKQEAKVKENLECLKITLKVMIVIIFSVSILTIVGAL